ncbi:hypothetical protein [Planktotalea sp.]|uniref:hypothetical protein n=1 Tax=Planktotalea sp. TaxID=2029877 RepID=UPI0025E6F5A9|nr:hypothetical protein [Planktotalea sp.]
MPRWLLWMPIAALTVATALFGLRAGWHVSDLNESDVISRAATDYLLGGDGRQATDCAAKPSDQRGVWLIVTCTSRDGASEVYEASRYGKVQLGAVPLDKPET